MALPSAGPVPPERLQHTSTAAELGDRRRDRALDRLRIREVDTDRHGLATFCAHGLHNRVERSLAHGVRLLRRRIGRDNVDARHIGTQTRELHRRRGADSGRARRAGDPGDLAREVDQLAAQAQSGIGGSHWTPLMWLPPSANIVIPVM